MALSHHLKESEIKSVQSWIRKVEEKRLKPHPSRKKGAKRSLNLSYKIIGCGKKRLVYDLNKKHVLKIAIAYNGIENNQREAIVYQAASKKIKKHLAKVIDFGYGWLVMEKINKKVPKSKRTVNKLLRMNKRFKKNNVIPGDLVSKKRKIRWPNIRFKDGNMVVIDYGNFKISS